MSRAVYLAIDSDELKSILDTLLSDGDKAGTDYKKRANDALEKMLKKMGVPFPTILGHNIFPEKNDDKIVGYRIYIGYSSDSFSQQSKIYVSQDNSDGKWNAIEKHHRTWP